MDHNDINLNAQAQIVIEQIRKVVVGKDKVLLWTLAAILAGGHILLEDIPGVGKTTMALAFARTMSLRYNRMQFNPDVLPSDVTGYNMLNPNDGSMQYQPGGVLCNLFLADELNRATSRTQSALLEAMEEGQVTVDGVTHKLPQPFLVIATQNPIGAAGTQLLPDSQLDRFMVRLRMGYPAPKDELSMLENRQRKDPMGEVLALMSREQLMQLQERVCQTFISRELMRYIVALIGATREHELVVQGASPRGTLAMAAMAKAVARLQGRDYVVPKDVQEVFLPVVAHRLILSPKAQSQNVKAEQVLGKILRTVAAPKLS